MEGINTTTTWDKEYESILTGIETFLSVNRLEVGLVPEGMEAALLTHEHVRKTDSVLSIESTFNQPIT